MAGEGEEFKGEYRKGPKTHLVRTVSGSLAPAKSYMSIKALLNALPAHQVMKQKYPKLFLKKGATNTRVAEEKQNVRVIGWMFDAKREEDEDYHVIVGTQSSGANNTFMNIEVSGLPPSGKDRTDLKAARTEFENIAQRTIPRSRYSNFTPPIKVRITGSLFFDGDHVPGSIGPKGHRPKTVWEIHPVAKIEAIQSDSLSDSDLSNHRISTDNLVFHDDSLTVETARLGSYAGFLIALSARDDGNSVDDVIGGDE